jgi:hypothetical protein
MCSRKQRLFSEVKSEGNIFKEDKKKEGADGFRIEYGAEFEPCGTATLLWHTNSEVQKSLSTKCLLHNICKAFSSQPSLPMLWQWKERKKNYIYLYIFSQEVWFYDVMPVG